MEKRDIRIIKFLIAIVMVVTVFLMGQNQVSFAENLTVSGILDKGNNFISQGQTAATISEDTIASNFLPIGRILVAVATATVFIVTAIMGIKWITATPDQQATLKKQLVGLVISIIVIYGAVGIWTLVKTIMENMTK